MGRRLIEVMQVLVDQVHKGGYQQRAHEENAFDLNKRLTEAEGWVAHWKQARQEAHEAGELMQTEIEKLKSRHAALANEAADDKLEKLRVFAEFRAARAEIETLRTQLADAQRAVSDAFAEVNSVREQLGAANVTILAQKAGNQYLRLLIDKVRAIMNREYNGREFEDIADALNDFDQGTLEPTPCPECERLRAFVQKARQTIGRTMNFCDVEFLLAALAELDAGAEPTPVAEPIDAEGDTCPDK